MTTERASLVQQSQDMERRLQHMADNSDKAQTEHAEQRCPSFPPFLTPALPI